MLSPLCTTLFAQGSAGRPNYPVDMLRRRPRSLQLTAADEIVAIENLDILKANGFEVDIDEEMPPGRGERVKLVAMPVSKETVFDYRGEYGNGYRLI